jgi:hypothetical protein
LKVKVSIAQNCSRNCRPAKSRRGVEINMANDNAKNLRSGRNGFDTVVEAIIARP